MLREPVVWLVVMSSVSYPVELAETGSVDGVKTQTAYWGRVPHWKAKEPGLPPSGVIARVKLAVWPLATVTAAGGAQGLVLGAQTVKSNPMPESCMVAGAASVALLKESVPLAAPAAMGENSTPTVQLELGASDATQVLLTRPKPADAERVMPE